MEGFTIVDGIVAAIVVMSALLAYSRGLVREAMAIVGWIIAAFAAVFTVALLLVSLFTPLFSSLIQRSALGGLDQALGFFFGVARGILLVAIAFFVYETVITAQDVAMIDDSRSAAVFSQFSGRIEEQNPEQALGWITAQYEQLVGVCDAPT